MNRFQGLKAHLRRTAGLTLALLMGLGTLAVPAMAEDTIEPLDLNKPISVVMYPQQLDKGFSVDTELVFDIYQIAEAENLSGFDTYTLNLLEGFQDITEYDINTKEDIDLPTWEKIAQNAANKILDPAQTKYAPIAESCEFSKSNDIPKSTNTGKYGGLYLLVIRSASTSGYKDYSNYLVDESMVAADGNQQVVTYADSDTMRYMFSPILFAAPSKTGAQDVTFNTSNTGAWHYSFEFYLKGQSERRKGSLRIVKDLARYENRAFSGTQASDPATFVFKINGYLNNVPIYSNVKSIVFDGSSEVTPIELTGLPAGAEFEISEIYQGQSYTYNSYSIDGGDPQTEMPAKVIVRADPKGTPETQTSANTVTVTFRNDWDNTYHGGGSIDNLYNEGGHAYKNSDTHNGEVETNENA